MAQAKALPQKPVADRTPVVATDLLRWYDRHRRDLPWRAKPGQASDPYAVWLSEIMLQQTTVAAVKPFFHRFLALWPDLRALAAASLDDVLKAWAGLGYYSRARNLHACARYVADHHGGRFPSGEDELRALPGIGPYTAAAIAAIAFGERAVVVDGNVERVMARLLAIDIPLPAAKPKLRAAMDRVTPDSRVGDFAQAVMDLGATVCTPRSPACVICPVQSHCRALAVGDPASYPRKAAKRAVPERSGAVFYVERADGSVLVRTRPSEGLFGGLTEFPGTPWLEGLPDNDPSPPTGVIGPLRRLGVVRHGLTHFTLTLVVYAARPGREQPPSHRWVARDALPREALPTLMKKVLACVPVFSELSQETFSSEVIVAVDRSLGLEGIERADEQRRGKRRQGQQHASHPALDGDHQAERKRRRRYANDREEDDTAQHGRDL